MNVYYKLVNTKVVNYFVKINPPPQIIELKRQKYLGQGCPTGIKKGLSNKFFVRWAFLYL